MTFEIELQSGDPTAGRARLAEVLQQASTDAGHPWAPVEINLVARQNGTEVGWFGGQIVYGWLWIMLLAVDPAARGGGIGRALMDKAEDMARTQGALGVNVDTFGFQAPHFYAALGFEEISRLPGRVAAEDRIFFIKPFV